MRRFARLLSIQLFVLLFPLSQVSLAEEEPAFSQRELDRVLAPIALYPDVVLSQVLMAATYPLEVVEAARWSSDNPGLDGEAAVEAVVDEDWDASVKALVAFPRLLARMDEDLDWTKRLGDAFLFQEAQVMDTIQDLRQRAYEAGNLDEPRHVRVIRDGDMIILEPTDPRIVYIPYYDTRVIYGGWWWPAHPPYYWTPTGYYAGAGFYWGSGILLSSGWYISHFNWPHRHVVIVKPPRAYPRRPGYAYWRDHAAQDDARHWRHDPRHRRGAVYRDRGSSHQYGRPRASAGGENIVVHKPDRPRGRHYWQGSRGGRDAVGRVDGQRRYDDRRDTRRAGADDGRRAQGNRYSGKRRDSAAVARAGSPRDMDSRQRRSGGHAASPRPPRALSVQVDRGRESARYYRPRQAAIPSAQIFTPRSGVGGHRSFAR
jgi:hypothetical protein